MTTFTDFGTVWYLRLPPKQDGSDHASLRNKQALCFLHGVFPQQVLLLSNPLFASTSDIPTGSGQLCTF